MKLGLIRCQDPLGTRMRALLSLGPKIPKEFLEGFDSQNSTSGLIRARSALMIEIEDMIVM